MVEEARASRDDKIRNLLLNQSVIFMGLFEEALADVGDRLAETKDVSGSARNLVSELLSEIREEALAQIPSPPELERHVADPAFDEGIEIAERYDLNLPRLTESLDDMTLASYIFLLKGGNPDATRMLRELQDWQKRLPKRAR